MVTVHNLGEKSATEVIDFVKKHLMKQNCKSRGEDMLCKYRGHNGTKCAAGCLIPDENYDPEMEGRLWKGFLIIGAIIFVLALIFPPITISLVVTAYKQGRKGWCLFMSLWFLFQISLPFIVLGLAS